jgi:YtkA-like
MVMKRIALAAAALVVVVWACSGDKGPAGGPHSGALDTHCTLPDGGTQVTVVNPASCQVAADGGIVDYGPTLNNAEADDDDCKYHVKFTVDPVYENEDVNFTVIATKKADGTPATGANIDAEVFLDPTHTAPNSGQHVTESPPGTYKVGPIRFDRPGKWTARFHLFEQCDDGVEDSPHGHVAFYIDVP